MTWSDPTLDASTEKHGFVPVLPGDATQFLNGLGKFSSPGGGVPAYSVTNYGAKLDGATDDSAAIQAAIDAAYNAGGGIVVIPGAGTGVSNGGSASAHGVVINSTLNLKAGVTLRGLGATTSLQGTANPMIACSPNSGQDRMEIRDMLLQSPAGVGIILESSGAFQLGWPRVTVENVTVADAVSHAFVVTNSQIEARLINCVSLRAGGWGFWIAQTDNMIMGCTAAAGSSDGFNIQGGNNKFSTCKAYGNAGNGYNVAGAGRHMFTSCESQDNVGSGFSVSGSWSSFAGCLADTDNIAGFNIQGSNNTFQGCSAMSGGGGSGQVTKCGFLLNGGTECTISGVSNCAVPVGGAVAGNTAYVNAAAGSRITVAYAATVTPDAYAGEVQSITLTGNIAIAAVAAKHVGQRLTFEFVQDATGGRTVTFASSFRTNWTPTTTARFTNIITFEFDGRVWQQVSAAVGLSPLITGVVDTFTRANGAIGTSSGGQVWTTFNQDGGASWTIASNLATVAGTSNFHSNIAVLDGGVPDPVITMTMQESSNGGMVWRYTDQNNYFSFGGNTVRRTAAGSTTTIQGGVLNYVNGDVMQVACQGGSYIISKNGVQQYSFADGFNQSATKAGMTMGLNGSVASAFAIS